jgi:hypothetical protein
METLASSSIEWGVASRALPGQPACGDRSVVKPFEDGVLVAVLDGVGHGEEAATAAAAAAAILEAHPAERLTLLVQRCHEALRATRGVAMSIASFNVAHGLMAWLGVGNVEGVLLRRGFVLGAAEKSLMLRAGVVGLHLPLLEAEVLPIDVGDALVLTTDGIRPDFTRRSARKYSPQHAAENILIRHGKTTDDALVLVARYMRDRP